MRKHLFYILILTLLLAGCSKSPQERQIAKAKLEAEALLHRNLSADSLEILINRFKAGNNKYGMMIAYRQLGKIQRDNTQFSDAINSHQNGLQYAVELQDTLEIVQGLNNMGTNFRRIGALAEALDYHFQALNLSKNFSSSGPREIKSLGVTLNGIGNISLMLGYYDEALNYFREALVGEIKLESHIGQAINYANIGAAFENKGEIDSARVYYTLSMENNIAGNSDMGIGLCYTHFGDLYKKEKRYDLAKIEYQKAYDLMENISDRWHWLEACLSIADIHLINREFEDFKKYIKLAEETAKDMESASHMSVIYNLKHEYDVATGNFSSALKNYQLSMAMNDSVQGLKNKNQYLDLRVNYEQNKYARSLQQIQAEIEAEQRQRENLLSLLFLASLAGVLLTAVLYYAYRQRTKSNETLRMMEKTRTDFFTGITHEFRTPLTVILGMADSIKKSNNNVKEAESIINQGNVLLNLVNQLLDMAKLKTRHEKTKWVNGDSVVYMKLNTETYQDYASKMGIDLRLNYSEKEILIDFIPEYFNKIVRNLVANALKHTPEGGTVDLVIKSEKNNLIFSVADTGRGIAEEDLNHIFDEFYQGSDHTESGTGIGLTLVKNMVEVMGGTISAGNRQGGGAKFTMTMPLKQKFEVTDKWIPEKAEQGVIHVEPKTGNIGEADSDDDGNSDDSRPSVLIVEDNMSIRQYIGSILEDDFAVRYASNGEEGIRRAKDFIPDIVITDLTMPVMDGIALSQAIRADEVLNHLPIIVITAKTSDEDRAEAFEAGADLILHKPFNPAELKIRVEKKLEQMQIMREKYSTAIKDGTTDKIDITKADRDFLNRIITIVHQHITSAELTPDFVSDKLFMSRSQLNRKVKQLTGYSISAYMLHIRLEKSKRLLRSNENPIGEIAMECGFEDSNYFSRVFKQVYDISPSHYRKTPAANKES